MQFTTMIALQKTLSVSLLFSAWMITFTSCSPLGVPRGIPPAIQRGFLFRVENIHNCEGYENKEFDFGLENIQILRTSQTEYAVNGDMCAKVELGGDWSGIVTLAYLETMDGSQPAELFKKGTDSVCNDTLVNYKEDIEKKAKYVENMDPKCPIAPGCYKIKEMPIDTSQINAVVKPGYYFVTVLGTMSGDTVWCTTLVLKCEFDDDHDEDDYDE